MSAEHQGAINTMAQATQSGPTVTGTLTEVRDDMIVVSLPGSDYRLHLLAAEPPVAVGRRITGRIFARAKRVDVIRSGGRYLEPLYGRPRRVQGRIIETDAAANTITVQAACALICELTMNQKASDFKPGQMVSFDIERGARFEPMT